MRERVALCLTALSGLVFVAGSAVAEGPDWAAVADVREVTALTTNEDGGARETTIWLAVLGGQGYIRTSQNTTWGGNAKRNPEIELRIEGREYPLLAVSISDAAQREAVVAAFREKYGRVDSFLDFMRGSSPRIMRLDPR